MIYLQIFIVFVVSFYFEDVSSQETTTDYLDDSSSTWYIFLDSDRDRMVMYLQSDTTRPIKDCYMIGDKFLINATLTADEPKNVTVVDSAAMDALIVDCINDTESKNYTYSNSGDVLSVLGWLSSFLIFPGTKYCGAGNISTGWDDLGPDKLTDECCRAHDACPDDIDGHSYGHGLYNDSPFTVSSCFCDYTLYTCLQTVDSVSSNLVGEINFNILQPHCFLEYYPTIGCSKTVPNSNRCMVYEYNFTAKIQWEFLDDPYYMPLSSEQEETIDNITSHLKDASSHISTTEYYIS